jgi:hypothetical protein
MRRKPQNKPVKNDSFFVCYEVLHPYDQMLILR